jgi:hypothetical protein
VPQPSNSILHQTSNFIFSLLANTTATVGVMETSSQLPAVCNAALVDWAVTREGLLALNGPHNIKPINNLHQQ